MAPPSPSTTHPFPQWDLYWANESDPTRFCSRTGGNPLRFRGFESASVNDDPMGNPETP